MGEVSSGNIRVSGNVNGIKMDRSGFRLPDGSSYNYETDTLSVSPDSVFTISRLKRGWWQEMFGLPGSWEVIAKVNSGEVWTTITKCIQY